MNSRWGKTILASVISLVLIYYSAAWAVLRCYHDYDHPAGAIEVTKTDGSAHRHASVLGGDSARIDCTDFDYHTEILAGPTAPPHIHRTATSSPYGDVVLPSVNRTALHRTNLFSGFPRVSTGAKLIYLPIYLFISNLRI
jgi:hypothetical protein